jgi:hypothetical protein
MDENELPKKVLWTNAGGQRGCGQPKPDGLTGYLKTQWNWVVEIDWWLPRIEVVGNICLRRPRPIQGCIADVPRGALLNILRSLKFLRALVIDLVFIYRILMMSIHILM